MSASNGDAFSRDRVSGGGERAPATVLFASASITTKYLLDTCAVAVVVVEAPLKVVMSIACVCASARACVRLLLCLGEMVKRSSFLCTARAECDIEFYRELPLSAAAAAAAVFLSVSLSRYVGVFVLLVVFGRFDVISFQRYREQQRLQ